MVNTGREKFMNFLKKHILTILIALIFFVGFSVLMYPLVSDIINSRKQAQATRTYDEEVKEITTDESQVYLDSAKSYNETLLFNAARFMPFSEEQRTEYESYLNFASNEVMGALIIDKIEVNLPIYHGTSEAVLQVGIGHLEGSSLPIGGESTHSAVSGHRGLPSAKLLTNLDRVTEGDRFSIRILNDELFYEVDQILTVLPHEMDSLEIVEGMDYCTLITCTPYGINSHRLLVRGRRVFPAEQSPEYVPIIADAEAVNTNIVAGIIFTPLALGFAVYLAVKFIRKKRASLKVSVENKGNK
jgi:sortase A